MTVWILLLLAFSGLAETVYLISCRLQKRRPICPAGESCSIVLESNYNSLFWIHNDIVGLFFYSAIIIDLLLIGMRIGFVPLEFLALNALFIGGACMSALLIYIQWKIIKFWCFWCLVSACINWLMAAVFFVAVLRHA